MYRAALAAVQRRIAAAGGSVPLSGLFHALAEFRSLLPPLHQLLHAVTARGIAGAPLLHMLHAKVLHPLLIADTSAEEQGCNTAQDAQAMHLTRRQVFSDCCP